MGKTFAQQLGTIAAMGQHRLFKTKEFHLVITLAPNSPLVCRKGKKKCYLNIFVSHIFALRFSIWKCFGDSQVNVKLNYYSKYLQIYCKYSGTHNNRNNHKPKTQVTLNTSKLIHITNSMNRHKRDLLHKSNVCYKNIQFPNKKVKVTLDKANNYLQFTHTS